jgi:cell division septum initiation protein DivIVA
MTVSLEVQQRIALLREKARQGTMTLDDCKEGIAFLRKERLAMPQAKASPRTKAATPNADDLLKDLGL